MQLERSPAFASAVAAWRPSRAALAAFRRDDAEIRKDFTVRKHALFGAMDRSIEPLHRGGIGRALARTGPPLHFPQNQAHKSLYILPNSSLQDAVVPGVTKLPLLGRFDGHTGWENFPYWVRMAGKVGWGLECRNGPSPRGFGENLHLPVSAPKTSATGC